ncbi:MAG TPA: SufE protein, partial [Pseudoalteromonas sp.]|nr:SufE protein [Pseudoalteromonas sp.]
MTNTFKNVVKPIQQAQSWQQKYREIMLLGKTLPALA